MNVDKNELSKKIGQLKGIVPKQTTIEALQGVLCKDGYLIASNNELTIKAKLEGMDNESFIIPSKAFDLINSLPSGDVTITCTDDVVTIQMGKIKNKFKTHPVSKFMYQRDSLKTEDMATIEAEKLKEAISHVLYAIPTAGSNQIMTGMYLEADGTNLNFVGLDGHRISWDCVKFDNQFKLIVPRAAVEKVLQLDLHGDVSISYDKNGAIFQTEDYEIYTRLIEGEYFAYKKMFSEGDIRTYVERKQLLEAINRARLCGAVEDKAPVMLQLEGTEMHVSYKNSLADYDEDIQLQEDVGDGIKIAFDPRLFLDCLKAFSCENIAMSFATKAMPLLIKSEDSDMTALVLPVNFKE